MLRCVTDIEVLLSVDAGRIPSGVMAFFVGDVDVAERRTYAVLSVLSVGAAAACAGLGAGRALVMLLVLAATALALFATPTLREDHDPRAKRPVIVITPEAIVMRDECGLKVWRFEDLTGVAAAVHDHRPQLVLTGRDGKRYAVDCLRFQNGERVREVVDQRLQSLRTQAG
jgi:hypothetical protein